MDADASRTFRALRKVSSKIATCGHTPRKHLSGLCSVHTAIWIRVLDNPEGSSQVAQHVSKQIYKSHSCYLSQTTVKEHITSQIIGERVRVT